MRFRKGARVEVMTHKEVPSGSWRCAEIIGGNGHTYTVKYEGDVDVLGKGIVERVPKKAIRPCPPSLDVLQDWVSGDLLEVFHNFSWKMATILKVLGLNYLLVRLLGSAIELKVSKFDVRARLCWQDGEWILIGKVSNKCEGIRFRFPSSRKDDNQTPNIEANVSRRVKRNLKRKQSHCHSQIEEHAKPKQKTIVGKLEFKVSQQHQLPEKVDDVACMHPSFMNKVTGCSELNFEREKKDIISLESDDENSVSSSVASCSIYYSHKVHYNFAFRSFGDSDSQHSDAESFYQLPTEEGNSDFFPPKEELTEAIHRLELHAYRCTIGALHASGPLSWEQELLLTNLRHSLHISNDEHLKEIRTLVSSSTCIPPS